MDVNKLDDAIDDCAKRAAASLYRTYGEHVEQEDLYQECALWALGNSRRIAAIKNKYGNAWPGVVRHSMVEGVSEYCRRQFHQRFPGEQMEPTFSQAQESFAGLPDRDQWLVEQVYLHKRTQADIAEELGVSQPRISQRWNSIIHRLRTGHLVTELQSEMPEGCEVA